MTQRELNRAVAQTTGEKLSTVRDRGFSLVTITSAREVVNWERFASERAGLFSERQQR